MEYEKEKLILDATNFEKKEQLINSIKKTQKELKRAHINFEFAEDELVDFYVYQIKALHSKLGYLTRIAKIKKIDFHSLQKKAV